LVSSSSVTGVWSSLQVVSPTTTSSPARLDLTTKVPVLVWFGASVPKLNVT